MEKLGNISTIVLAFCAVLITGLVIRQQVV
jgi:hypothetical protein